jgi:acyl-coenzyme A thioesterase PaaI-like protein
LDKELKAFQDYYADEVSHCFGCGRLNQHGLQIKSYWDGNEAICTFKAQPYYTAIPGLVYGGLTASLIDCHSTGTAAAAAYQAQGREMGTEPRIRYVTGSLHVDYLRPASIDKTITVRAHVVELKGRKVVVRSTLYSGDEACARGEVIAVRMPDDWLNPDRWL